MPETIYIGGQPVACADCGAAATVQFCLGCYVCENCYYLRDEFLTDARADDGPWEDDV